MMITSTPKHYLAAALVLLLPCAVTSQADEYSLDYSVNGGYEFNDNVNLIHDDEVDISGAKVSLPATLAVRNERLDASVMGEVASSKFNESDYDSNDQNLQAKASYKLQRGTVAGKAGFKRDSTRTSEFLDTGVVGVSAVRRESATVGGSADYMLTEKNGLIAGIDYADVTYDGNRFTDYNYTSGYAGWQNQWSERSRLRLQAYGNRYENDGSVIEVSSDSLGVQAGIDSTLSEQLSLSLLAGWVSVDTEYSTDLPIAPPADDDSNGYLLNASLDYQQPRYTLSAKIKSDLTPSGDGYLRQTSQLDLSYRYDVSERSRFELALVGGTSKALDSRINNDRYYARARLRLDYRVSPSWYVAGTYTYSYQDRDRAQGTADSNAVYLSLIFHPEKNVWSR
jgi:hypothetical protein